MIEVSKDNQEVYAMLEKEERLFSDFSIDHIFLFESKDDLYLVTYIASSRNFISFRAFGAKQDKNALPLLLEKLQEEEVILPSLLNKGVRLIEDKMFSKDNDRFYFDAH